MQRAFNLTILIVQAHLVYQKTKLDFVAYNTIFLVNVLFDPNSQDVETVFRPVFFARFAHDIMTKLAPICIQMNS